MTIPRLPTDNLYKFVALSGVALLLVGLVASESGVATLLKQDALLTVAIEELNARVSAVGSNPEDAAEAVQLDALREVTALRDQIFEVRRQSELKDLELGAVRRTLRIYRIAEMSGAVLASVGFILWYRRVQRYQDAILKKRATAVQDGGEDD